MSAASMPRNPMVEPIHKVWNRTLRRNGCSTMVLYRHVKQLADRGTATVSPAKRPSSAAGSPR
jgi:hypothetical protein